MEQQEYDRLCKENGAIQLAHPEFDKDYHEEKWNGYSCTFLVCQRKTLDATKLCIESLLRWYPDANILVVDGDSQDDSTIYLRYKAASNPRFVLWERIGRNSHGISVDEAIHNHITTSFVILLDSDVIINRGGFVEGMVSQYYKDSKLYSTGSLMLVSKSNFGCGAPVDEEDILRYSHPSACMIHIPTYKSLQTGGNDNGAPFAHNMIIAQAGGLHVGAFPIDKYISHRSGTSWIKEHQIIWQDDYDVFIRPFITFVATLPEHLTQLQNQTDKDFNIITKGNHTDIRVWDGETKDVSNSFYSVRYNVNGEYVCVLNESVGSFVDTFVHDAKVAIIQEKAPDTINVGGLVLTKRKVWQAKDALV